MAPQRDVGSAVMAMGLAVLAAWALWTTREFSMFGSIFPRTAGAVLLVGSLAVAWRDGRPRALALPDRWQGLGRGLALVAVMAVWIAWLEEAGFATSSGAAFALLAWLALGARPTLRQLLVGALATALLVGGLQLVFEQLLSVQLPDGRWWKGR